MKEGDEVMLVGKVVQDTSKVGTPYVTVDLGYATLCVPITCVQKLRPGGSNLKEDESRILRYTF